MALTTCPDCQKDVSTSAVSCPNCGAPVAAAAVEARAAGAPLTTTQGTSKKLKAQQLFAILAVFVGLFWAMADAESGSPSIGALILVVGFLLFAIVQILMWWHHG